MRSAVSCTVVFTGRGVEGRYSTDLFVNRAKEIFQDHKRKEAEGNSKPWFTYLSFQAVHDPLQVTILIFSNNCLIPKNFRFPKNTRAVCAGTKTQQDIPTQPWSALWTMLWTRWGKGTFIFNLLYYD